MTQADLDALAAALGLQSFAQLQQAVGYMLAQMAVVRLDNQLATLDVQAATEQTSRETQRQALAQELAAAREAVRTFGQ